VRRTYRPLSRRHWARRLAAGTPASKLCSPRESVRRRLQRLARQKSTVGALLGFFSSRALSTTVPGSVFREDARRGHKPQATRSSGHPAIAVARRDPDSDAWVREPRIRRYAGSIEPRASPSGGDPAHPRFMSAKCASRQLLRRPRGRSKKRLARAPSRRRPAPPCPWRAEPRRVRRAGPRRR